MKITRIVASVLGICFIGFAALQYNDPDAALWIIVYFVAASVCFSVVKNNAPILLLVVASLVYGIGVVYMWPPVYEGVSIGGGDINNIEEARESLGLGLCSISFAVLALLKRFNSKGSTSNPGVAKQNGLA